MERNLAVIPGGIAELMMCSRDTEALYVVHWAAAFWPCQPWFPMQPRMQVSEEAQGVCTSRRRDRCSPGAVVRVRPDAVLFAARHKRRCSGPHFASHAHVTDDILGPVRSPHSARRAWGVHGVWPANYDDWRPGQGPCGVHYTAPDIVRQVQTLCGVRRQGAVHSVVHDHDHEGLCKVATATNIKPRSSSL